ncbi:NUDIX domain-containing protein [Streptomyces sp. TRM66268-LWL]|uniref:NUDIX domain-containing protein n=1 Tax=Streptomyces polyasparticus TaxID=2767826 RepID=A0ABR7SR69_9ACTN|nr:NUDIX domain-containing protein [Streptomyces polyasparticus]MBC9718005.1 NUDIX domain-containing protein [Streptomyces polyasparticus]
MTTKYSVECWIFAPDQRVLLLQVPARPGKHDAFWQPVTGGIEGTETPREAVLREIAEETALQLTAGDVHEVATGIDVVISPELTVSKTLFTANAPHTDVVTAPDEHQDHQWVAADHVAAALFWDSNRETWNTVQKYLTAESHADDA